MRDFSALDALFERALNDRFFPGAVCCTGTRDGIDFIQAYGKKRCFSDDAPCFDARPAVIPDSAEDADTETMYDMASCTKVLATTPVALKLLADGYFALGDPISRFIDVPEDKKNITVFQLLTHTSGLIPYINLFELGDDREKVFRALMDIPLNRKPGTDTEYSCIGFITLMRIIEKVTSLTLDAAAKEICFDPLGMKHTCYNPTERGYTNIATTEYSERLGAYKCGVVHDETAAFLGGVSGNAGLFSTASDVASYALMLARGGEGLYPESAFRAATADHTPTMSESRGLGFQISRKLTGAAGDFFSPGSFGHTGYTGTSLFVDAKTGVFAVLLTNRVHFTRFNSEHVRFRRLFHNVVSVIYSGSEPLLR